jgi:hypothetical protein
MSRIARFMALHNNGLVRSAHPTRYPLSLLKADC